MFVCAGGRFTQPDIYGDGVAALLASVGLFRCHGIHTV
jgi:hypothetical protein